MKVMGWIYILFLLSIVNLAVSLNSIKQFLNYHSSIDTPRVFRKFKQLVRQQMVQSLIQIGLLVPMALLGLSAVYNNAMSSGEFLIWLLLNAAIIGTAKSAKKYEDAARSLPVANPEMEEQYKNVCQCWIKKPLPDF